MALPPALSAYRIEDVSVATEQGRPRATVTVQLTRSSGVAETRRVPVVREDDEWLVCGDPF